MPAVPGMSQQVTVGGTVTLDGTASQARTYIWALTQIPDGSRCVLLNAYTAQPSFVADVPGTYVVTLGIETGSMNSLGVLATTP